MRSSDSAPASIEIIIQLAKVNALDCMYANTNMPQLRIARLHRKVKY